MRVSVSVPVGYHCSAVAQLPRLTAGLLARGHSEEAVCKVLGENLLRVVGQVESIARAVKL